MKANELMIGDWVCTEHDSTPRQIDWIRTGEVGLLWNKVVTPPYLVPIPLAQEILEKNGFECNSNTKTFYCILSDEPKLVVEVRLWDKDTNIRIGKQCDATFRVGYDWYINGMEILFVHELQHALHLCGIDKEITI